MTLFSKIRHFLAQKIYYAVQIIDNESRIEISRRRLSSLKQIGRNVNIDNIVFFGGGQYMSIGDDFYCKGGG